MPTSPDGRVVPALPESGKRSPGPELTLSHHQDTLSRLHKHLIPDQSSPGKDPEVIGVTISPKGAGISRLSEPVVAAGVGPKDGRQAAIFALM